jgi:hypothetical protein
MACITVIESWRPVSPDAVQEFTTEEFRCSSKYQIRVKYTVSGTHGTQIGVLAR